MASKIKGYNKDPIRANGSGQRFFIGYGFVRGKDVNKTEDAPLTTSKDGYNCYLLIAEKKSRHLWIFLFENKNPTIGTVTDFLKNHRTKSGLK